MERASHGTTAPDAAIVCTRVTRCFGSLRAVDGLDLSVPRGTVFGFLGPNGAGKTTTIRLLLGLLAPTSGHVRVLGVDLPGGGAAVRARSGVVLDHHGLYEGMPVRASLEFAAAAYGLGPRAAAVRVREVVAELGLSDRLDARPQSLSRGMRQRMAVARALLGRPELLVLDEPTNGLDAEAAAGLRRQILQLVSAGTTVFLTTHLLAEAERMCDLVAVVRDGRVVASGTPAELRRGTQVRRVRVEGPGVARHADALAARGAGARPHGSDALVVAVDDLRDVPDVVATLVAAGARIQRVEPVGQTLEAAFLALLDDDAARVAPLGAPRAEAPA